jgi:BirA family biotin operon repressor/biotin-[acetyl-CoA-carboxylase] ligase
VTEGPDGMPPGAPPFLARLERLGQVASTNDIVREWLADGVDEVAIAVADEQTAGRGREGRTWTAPPGSGLLLSAGFRPTYLAPERAWRLAASVALAMAEAAEDIADLPAGTIRLKWPNDLAIATGGDGDLGAFEVRKLAGLLGETEGLGTGDPRAIVGIGVNVDWPADAFPPELAASMTSLREIAGAPVDRERLLTSFMGRLEGRVRTLHEGGFDAAGWADRQVTTGRLVRLEGAGERHELVRAAGVDTASGALLVEALDPDGDGRPRPVLAGEITHLRLPSAAAV